MRKQLIFTTIIIVSSIGSIFADANITTNKSKTIDTNKIVDNNKTAKGTTIGKYQKPSAPIDITYRTTKVKLNEPSDINISFTTSLKSGEMEVNINIDKDLKTIGEVNNKIIYSINPNQKEYNLNFQVSSSKNGLYYIRLLMKINDMNRIKTKAFAIPIYIGNGKLQKKGYQLVMKSVNGRNLSISEAEETVEVLK